jgi:hypothetical protein
MGIEPTLSAGYLRDPQGVVVLLLEYQYWDENEVEIQHYDERDARFSWHFYAYDWLESSSEEVEEEPQYSPQVVSQSPDPKGL